MWYVWRLNCEQLAQFHAESSDKDAEIESLNVRLTVPESPGRSSVVPTSEGADPALSTTPRGVGRGVSRGLRKPPSEEKAPKNLQPKTQTSQCRDYRQH